jgi:subtilisin family serine protease
MDRQSQEIGRIYHRANDPNTPDHHIDVVLRSNAPAGLWKAYLIGEEVVDGRFDAWIERDSGGPRRQSRFAPRDVDPNRTIGSIANTFHTITIGAADTTGRHLKPAKFASRGPTRDGRIKPDLLAPGVAIRAARSTPRRSRSPMHLNTSMSGASQAAPAVAGVAALCLQAAEGQLDLHDMRRALLSSARPLQSDSNVNNYLPPVLNPDAAIGLAMKFARQLQSTRQEENRYAS